MKSFKCQVCGHKKEEDLMEVVTIVSPTTQKKRNLRYCKDDCYDSYLKEREFKRIEREELDYLTDVILKVHGIEVIPKQFFPHLQDIRNGSILFGKIKRKQKKGYSYKVIAETYKHVEESIDWAKKTKTFNDTMSELKYGLAIVCNNLSLVRDKLIEHERQQKVIEIQQENMAKQNDITPKKSSNRKRTDITKFL
jgi:hypothetical protein